MFKKLREMFSGFSEGFSASEEGQGLVEYALILVLVAVVVIVVLIVVGPVIGNVFSDVIEGFGGVAADCSEAGHNAAMDVGDAADEAWHVSCGGMP